MTKRFYPRHGSRGVVILLYHRIAELAVDPWKLAISPRRFTEHLEVISRVYKAVELRRLVSDLSDGKLPHRSVVITFDDGYEDNLRLAKPLLEKYDVPATFFIATGLMENGREAWWDELERILLYPGVLPTTFRLQLGGSVREWDLGERATYTEEEHQRHRAWNAWHEPPPHARHALYLELHGLFRSSSAAEQRQALDQLHEQIGSTPEVRRTHRFISPAGLSDLAGCELIEVGVHTRTHPMLPVLSAAEQGVEIAESKRWLEEAIGCPVRSFAYPYGAYTKETISAVRQAGFVCACTAAPGSVRKGTSLYELPRLYVRDWDGEELDRRLFEVFNC